MRVHRDNAAEGEAGQGLDIRASQSGELDLVPEPAGRIAAIALFIQHREVDAGLTKELDERSEAALVAQVETGLADPEQDLDLSARLDPGKGEVARKIETGGQRAPRLGVRLG